MRWQMRNRAGFRWKEAPDYSTCKAPPYHASVELLADSYIQIQGTLLEACL